MPNGCATRGGRRRHEGPPRVGTINQRAQRFRIRAACIAWCKRRGPVRQTRPSWAKECMGQGMHGPRNASPSTLIATFRESRTPSSIHLATSHWKRLRTSHYYPPSELLYLRRHWLVTSVLKAWVIPFTSTTTRRVSCISASIWRSKTSCPKPSTRSVGLGITKTQGILGLLSQVPALG